MSKFNTIAALAIATLLAGCATAPAPKNYSSFNAAKPRSILIVPVINHTTEVEAGDLFLTTLAVPLAERGYYVFPTSAVKKLMEGDGLSNPQLVHEASTPRVAELSGADAVLYVEILEWHAQYAVLASGIEVSFLYTLKNGHDNSLLWQDQQKIYVQRSGGSGNILADVIAAAVTAAIDNTRSDYTPVAAMANNSALLIPGQGIPFGPYSTFVGENPKVFPSLAAGPMTNATLSAVAYPVEGLPTGFKDAETPVAKTDAVKKP